MTRTRTKQITTLFHFATLALISSLGGCSWLKTGASAAGTAVVTTAKVAGTAISSTADVAKSTVTTGAVLSASALSGASAVKSTSVATAGAVVAGVSLVGNVVLWGIALRQNDVYAYAPLTALGTGLFKSVEGQVIEAPLCDFVAIDTPATLVHSKTGMTEVRVEGTSCPVTRVQS